MVHQFTMQKDVICLASAKSQRWYWMSLFTQFFHMREDNTCRMEIRLFNDTNRLYDFIGKGEEGNYDGIAFT